LFHRNINGDHYIGSIAGHIFVDNMANSYSVGNINNNDEVSGIAGFVYYKLTILNSAAINSFINGTKYINCVVGYIMTTMK
jgi:hypothetical protein